MRFKSAEQAVKSVFVEDNFIYVRLFSNKGATQGLTKGYFAPGRLFRNALRAGIVITASPIQLTP